MLQTLFVRLPPAFIHKGLLPFYKADCFSFGKFDDFRLSIVECRLSIWGCGFLKYLFSFQINNILQKGDSHLCPLTLPSGKRLYETRK